MELKTNQIRTDGGTQARAQLDNEAVQDYRDILKENGTTWPFPPVVVFHDGSDYWLADGFHRIAAARQHGRFVVEAEVRQGQQRDAILYAAGANADHGLKRTTEDKQRAVTRLLEDAEWGQWSDREIARRCKVSATFVGGLRSTIQESSEERIYTTKHGTQAVMNTSKIGADRTSEGKRLTVMRLLESEETWHWSDREISRLCKVSPGFVGTLRLTVQESSEERTYTTKHGTQAVMNTSKIGEAKRRNAIPITEEEKAIIDKYSGKKCIYVLTDGDFFKIGFSSNIRNRYLSLAGNPSIKLLHCFPGEMSAEKTLHRKYKDKQQSGEWFSLNSDDIQWLLSIEDEAGLNSKPAATAIKSDRPTLEERRLTWILVAKSMIPIIQDYVRTRDYVPEHGRQNYTEFDLIAFLYEPDGNQNGFKEMREKLRDMTLAEIIDISHYADINFARDAQINITRWLGQKIYQEKRAAEAQESDIEPATAVAAPVESDVITFLFNPDGSCYCPEHRQQSDWGRVADPVDGWKRASIAYSFIINMVNTASGAARTQGWQEVAEDQPGKVWGLIKHCRSRWMEDALLRKVALIVLNKKGDTPISWKSKWAEEATDFPYSAIIDAFSAGAKHIVFSDGGQEINILDRAIATEAAEKDEVLDLLKRAESALCLAVVKYNAAARPSFSQANRAYHALLLVIDAYKKEMIT